MSGGRSDPHGSTRARLTTARNRLAGVGRRSQQVLVLAGVTGAAIGLLVAGFDRLVAGVLLGHLLQAPLWVQLVVPGLGLLAAAALLRLGGPGTTPATSDEYVQAFHDPRKRLAIRPAVARSLAAVATLGAGGPLGYEGPSLYAGATLGSWLQRHLPRVFSDEDPDILMVAGAAAGVAAIFKAPVTGMVFALEVPYQQDLARHHLLPAAISSAAAYVTFAAVAGTDPILPVTGQPPFNLVDLGGAAAVGLLCGVLARVFVTVMLAAKRVSGRGHPAARAVVGGIMLAATVAGAARMGGGGLALGPGYDAIRWALDPDRTLVAIAVLATLRVIGDAAVVGGGGTGGLFVPLVVQGALVGRVAGGLFGTGDSTLFPVVGIAAFLGAGYRVPLAAVVFVAEFTGRPGYVVPGLIAAVLAQLVMGDASASPYQLPARKDRLGHDRVDLGDAPP